MYCSSSDRLESGVRGMEATQVINDSFFESDEETNEEEKAKEAKEPLAKLCILKNDHVPEREFPLFIGDNILGRDVSICTLPLMAPSVSKQHATIAISVHRRRGSRRGVDMEALVWDLGSMNGTRKGRLKLTPNVRYSLNEGDHLLMADIPCHFVTRKITREGSGHAEVKCQLKGSESETHQTSQFSSTFSTPTNKIVPESDIDMEEDGGEAEPALDQKPKAACFHMDSDTDVDDEDDAMGDGVSTSLQPKAGDEFRDMSPSAKIADKATPVLLDDFQLDSDTDVDEEAYSTSMDETPSKLNSIRDMSGFVENQTPGCSTHLNVRDSTTGSNNSNVMMREPPQFSPVATTPSSVAHGITATAAQLDCKSSVPSTEQDSDTDVEEGKNPIHFKGMKKQQENFSTPVPLSGMDEMDTQVFFNSSLGPLKDGFSRNKGSVLLFSSLDIPEEEDMVVADTQYFVPQTPEQNGSSLNNVSLMSALDHETSELPVIGASFQQALSDTSNLQSEAQALPSEGTQAFGMLAEAETQMFSNTSSVETTSLGNDLKEETSQSFKSPKISVGILKSNRHVVLALEETQAYVSESCGESEEETEEETQPFDLPKNPAIDLLTTKKPSVAFLQQNQILQETDLRREQEQLDKEMQSDTSSRGSANRQLISFAATQPMAVSETEESDDDDDGSVLLEENVQSNLFSHGLAACKKSLSVSATQPVSTSETAASDSKNVTQVSSEIKTKLLKEKQSSSLVIATLPMSIAATQPLLTSENEESSDEDLTQDMLQANTSSLRSAANHFMSIAATQPIANSENEETDSEDPIPVLREGQVQLDKEIQPNKSTPHSLSIAATQPLATIENESDDEEDSIPIFPKKRKARQLQDTQSLCSNFETPSDSSTCRNPNVQTPANNDENRSGHGHEKEQTQALVSSEVSSAETQLMDLHEDDSEILICSSRKRKARPLQIDDETQSLTGSQPEMRAGEMDNSKTSAVESQSPSSDKPSPKSEKKPSELRTSQTAHSKTLSQQSEKEKSLDKRQSESQAPRQQSNLEGQNRDLKHQNEVVESKRIEETSRSETVDEEETLERPETKSKRQKVDGAKTELQQNDLSKPKPPRRSQREKRTTVKSLSTAVLDEGLAKRTRSRSNSSNSFSSEMSPSSTQRSQGRGQSSKTSNRSGPSSIPRKRTVAADPSGFPDNSEQDKSLDSSLGSLSRSTSSNSLASEMSCSSSSRGSRSKQRVIEGKKESGPSLIQSTLSPNPAPKATSGGKRTRKTEVSTTEVSHEAVNKPESKQVVATRGKRRANVEEPSNLANNSTGPPSKRNIRGKGKSQVLEAPVAPTNKVKAKDKGVGRKKMLEVDVKDENPAPIQDKRRTRASLVPVDKNVKESPGTSADSGVSVQPQTPISKRQTRDSSHSYKVLFTGVVDQDGEKVVTRLGGVLAKGTADMNCLVTDMVRRTVKFLCAVAKGIPIVNTQWLHKSAKAGTFLAPEAFSLNDPAQELNFNFCLQETLLQASRQPLFKGYKIHVTKSVQPEPVFMKDIISCCGATFAPKMPSTNKPYTLVVSCPEDWLLCRRAVSASLPIVTAEFIISGVLQHKVDFDTHKLSGP
ncbi:mediator of DNA damage checkpoint protein 1 isoform X2 [Stigmatopora nigra]